MTEYFCIKAHSSISGHIKQPYNVDECTIILVQYSNEHLAIDIFFAQFMFYIRILVGKNTKSLKM